MHDIQSQGQTAIHMIARESVKESTVIRIINALRCSPTMRVWPCECLRVTASELACDWLRVKKYRKRCECMLFHYASDYCEFRDALQEERGTMATIPMCHDDFDECDDVLMNGRRRALIAAAGVIILRRQRRRRISRDTQTRRQRRVWVRNWLLRRPLLGHYETLMTELAEEDIPGYVSYQRMYPEMFAELLEKVTPLIQKKMTKMREPIPPGLRLALTLRYLATGNTYMSEQFAFRVANNTISKIVPDTCRAIFEVLASEYLHCPATPDEWREVANDFQQRWNFPNCVGAVDGKHVAIRAPRNTGSTYFNYKGFFSIVLMGVVDARYRFLYVDVGCTGRSSDGGVFGGSDLHDALEDNSINLPDDGPLPNDNTDMPFCLVGDDAFSLRRYMMKPYAHRRLTNNERRFNYRLSRARRIVENAFGILSNRFRVLLSTILVNPETVEYIVLACCALHNLLITRYPRVQNHLLDREDDVTHQVIPGLWRSQETMLDANVLRGNNGTKAAKAQRDYLCAYFNSEAGSVPWQDDMI